ncbi:MAG TPA: 30S ribosomal protein S9 [Gemmatimonadota bacterium]|nr:30S ribosomal protein S9 [Gemmatimonadota bacterium]
MAKQAIIGIGRRKTAVARVYLRPGKGNWKINGRALADYFPRPLYVQQVQKPLAVGKAENQYDITVNVRGGGQTGQAGAVALGIARALVAADAELRPTLKAEGLLTRDPRMVERKKYGRPKARKRFQFSKR